MKEVIKKMKAELQSQLDEWLGFDIPEEGSEDYDTWQSRQMDIEDIQSFADVFDYLDGDEERATEFFESFGISDFQSKL